MGTIWLHKLPDYLERWCPGEYELMDGWEDLARSSGGLEQMQAVGIHHDASAPGATLAGTFGWSTINSPDAPIGNGSGTRTVFGPRFRLWAAGASNTQGRGGPVLTSRGVIPLNDGNRRMVSIEWMNNGSGEPWAGAEEDLYLRVVCAVLDWGTHETPGAPMSVGDVFAHFEWTNPGAPYGSTRKIDPWGPTRWNNHTAAKWDMTAFRRDLFATYSAGAPAPTPEDDMTQEQAAALIALLTDMAAAQQATFTVLQSFGPKLDESNAAQQAMFERLGTFGPKLDEIVAILNGADVITDGDAG